MNFAVHYSRPAADLLDTGKIAPDYFKCPAWPDLIATVQAKYPLYVHFPLRVGQGTGEALDTETHRPADWTKVEMLLARTNTPFVNVHLEPTTDDHPDIPADTTDPGHIAFLTDCLIRDLRAVVARFGPERVIAENVPNGDGCLRPAYMPAVIRRVVEECGCGLLLDLSHARRAARALGMDAVDAIAMLPVERTREIHSTGIQQFDDHWMRVLRGAGLNEHVVAQFAGRWQDHLPFTDADWAFTAWSLGQIARGHWGQPWIVALEYGGVGSLWEALTDAAVLAAQVPRLAAMVHACRVPENGENDG
ncbi:MAG: multinuclear nonheme iron-dependent oxidase [Thermomicrobiales bacterium]